MPRIKDLNDMRSNELFNWLCILPTSVFKGKSVNFLRRRVNKHHARQYLVNLMLLNDRNKSQLFIVTESSIEVSVSISLGSSSVKQGSPMPSLANLQRQSPLNGFSRTPKSSA